MPRSEGRFRHSDWQLAVVDAHLEQCTQCRADMKDVRLAAAALRQASRKNRLQAPSRSNPDFADRVMRRVRAEENAGRNGYRQRRSIGGLASGAACLAAVIIVSGANSALHARGWWFAQVRPAAPKIHAMRQPPPFALHDPFTPTLAFSRIPDVDLAPNGAGIVSARPAMRPKEAPEATANASSAVPAIKTLQRDAAAVSDAAEAMITAEAAEHARPADIERPSAADARLVTFASPHSGPRATMPLVLVSSAQATPTSAPPEEAVPAGLVSPPLTGATTEPSAPSAVSEPNAAEQTTPDVSADSGAR